MAPVRLQSRSASSSFVCCRVRPTLLCDGEEDDALLAALFQSAMLQLWHPEPFHPIVLRFSPCLNTILSSRPCMSNAAHPHRLSGSLRQFVPISAVQLRCYQNGQ